MTRRALIWGVTGQDGSYLARLLRSKDYEVHGTSRSANPPRASFATLGVEGVAMHTADPVERDAVERVIEQTRPDEIYYLAAQSSVGQSFVEPLATWRSSVDGLRNVLEAARAVVPQARLLNAASGDCFGETTAASPARETTRFAPRSPYAAAKCASHHAVEFARIAHGQFACSAFLFGHESPLRSERFVIGKLIAAIGRMTNGSDETLALGDIEVVRDWGWAPDYVEAMWRMLQQDAPQDFIVATGRSHRLGDLLEALFAAAGLDWRERVKPGAAPPRASDIRQMHADPSKAREVLGWASDGDLSALASKLLGAGQRA